MPLRRTLLLIAVLLAAPVALAQSLAPRSAANAGPPIKPNAEFMAKVAPPVVRQGGDTVADATPITSLPFWGEGTTEGFTNDYDAACPLAGSSSPDVVYSFTRPEYGTLTIDFCGSSFDTKIYVMLANGEILDCNDDVYDDLECGHNTSRIDNFWVPPGETMYLVVDGHGGAAGSYTFEMRRWIPDDEPGGGGGDEGGDTIFSATPIASIIPQYHGTGTTVGFVNDYDAICPYSGSTSPDVVYSYVCEAGVPSLSVDLCYSSYDTKVYMYDSALNLIACNDDYYFAAPCYTYSSAIFDVPVSTGQTYYIIIDGYGGASGEYDMVVSTGAAPCDFTCPTPHYPEGEVALYNGYVDTYDAGCNTAGYPFKDLSDACDAFGNLTLCGNAGWYLSPGGSQYRDTDWYYLKMGTGGAIDVTVDAAQPTYIFELGPQDCASVAVLQSVIGGDCQEAYMTITGYAEASIVWFWAGSTTFVSPDGSNPVSYPYACWFTGLFPGSIVTEPTTWSTMKAMFR